MKDFDYPKFTLRERINWYGIFILAFIGITFISGHVALFIFNLIK
jgi:hypothetical protein